jgi:hypothetical protein
MARERIGLVEPQAPARGRPPARSAGTPLAGLQRRADASPQVAQLRALQARAMPAGPVIQREKFHGPKNGNHIHEYGGGFHIKIAGTRYDIVQGGIMKPQDTITAAFDAARAAGENGLVAIMKQLLRAFLGRG